MRYKNGIIALTAIISALCLFFFSFTWKADSIRSDAAAFATSKDGKYDPVKNQVYIDSLWNKSVYLGFTLKEVTELELHKGLDLQGGLHVVLEVSPVELLKSLAGQSNDPDFLKALAEAQKAQTNSQDSFQESFYQAFAKVSNGRPLASIFSNSVNRDKISSNSTDAVVKGVLNNEINSAIERAYLVIRSRVDKFGVTNPNIQRLPGTSRIQVELPAIDNPERARKLLSGAAKLEFCEVYEYQQYAPAILQLASIVAAEEKIKAKSAAPSTSLAKLGTDSSKNSLASKLTAKSDTAKKDTAAATSVLGKLFQFNGYNLQVALKDTARANALLHRPEAKAMLPADLNFCWVLGNDKSATDGKASDQDVLGLEAVKRPNGQAPLSGDVITDARNDRDQVTGKNEVSMTMNPDGARRWKNMTGANIGKRIAIVLDDIVYSAPNVNGEIPNGNSQITGNFTIDQAKDLANVLKAGKLPAPTRIVEEAYIGPSLGKAAINQGYMSMAIGLLLVVIFMFLYYGNSSWVANLALLFNVFFLVGVLIQIKTAFTLPGIAGIVLTMGMAIDANVLINERIKEELHAGKGLLEAIQIGYEKAWSAIIDGNITTILIGVILWW